ncbi:MAG: hypothetical protein K6U08_05870 [Firmicutes bacterium]|nr:hypothetical protein [Bacillota bacterium]
MQGSGFGPVLIAGAATVGALHALLPDHWLPFVLLSRARGWNVRRSLVAAVIGGLAHLGSTAALGVLVAFLGAEALERVGTGAELAGAGVLGVFGAVLALRGLATVRRLDREGHGERGHRHGAAVRERSHDPGGPPRCGSLAEAAVLGLRPCAEAVPVFLAASAYGVGSSLLTVLAWVLATLGALVAMVWVSLLGLGRLRADLVARYGEVAAGALILLLGLGAALAAGH